MTAACDLEAGEKPDMSRNAQGGAIFAEISKTLYLQKQQIVTHFRVSKINLDDGNVVFFFTTMNIETMAGYVSYFIFQSETPIYPTALFQKHRLKSLYEG